LVEKLTGSFLVLIDDMTLDSIRRLKHYLSEFIEPDFGLLNQLLNNEVLNSRQCAKVRGKETVFDRNDVLLELLASEEQCRKFLDALERTDQQHVANFIRHNGGLKQFL